MNDRDEDTATHFSLRLVDDGIVGARVQRLASEAHLHAAWTLCVMRRGRLRFVVAGRPYCVCAGDAFVVRPFDLHWGRAEGGPIEYDVFYVSRARMRDWLGTRGVSNGERMGATIFDLAATQTPAGGILNAEKDCAGMIEAGRALEMLRNLVSTLSLPVDAGRSVGRATDLALAAASRLTSGPSEPSIRQIADELEVSPAHLSRVFRSHHYTTPLVYRQQIRVARAAASLASGMNLSEVAHSAGFSDQAHMNRIFKKTYGFTPGLFARQYRRVVESTNSPRTG